MLTELNIRNLAIVDAVTLRYRAGLSVFTGETGAGKSIIVDALTALMGGKIDPSMVRSGSDGLDITACFDQTNMASVNQWLDEQGLAGEEDEDCILRRLQPTEGRGRAFINGRPVPLAQLRALASQLVEVHGQHAHQSLLKPAAQRNLLDQQLSSNGQKALNACVDSAGNFRELQDKIAELQQADGPEEDRQDYLRFLISELESANLIPEELAELDAEHQKAANASKIGQACQFALSTLYDEETGNAYELICSASSQIEPLSDLDHHLKEALELTESAKISLEESAKALRDALDQLDVDPARLSEIEARLATWHELARKHRCEPDELPEKLVTLRQELDEIEHRDQRIAELTHKLQECRDDWEKAALSLTKARTEAAETLSAEVSQWLRQLGMPAANFRIAIEQQETKPRPQGQDAIVFLLQANPGQAEAPLEKAASGGELSRTGLALKVSALKSNQTGTLIFDEVDSGIGGETADVVGSLLAKLGLDFQVLVVTHLPQVAAHGDQHYKVRKEIIEDRTFSRVEVLNSDARSAELARMLSGNESETALAHARELLDKSGKH